MSAVKMKAGKSKDMQYWLRARVALQGLTLVALVAGSMAIQASRKAQLSDNGASSLFSPLYLSDTTPADGAPRNEVATELLREQKKEREKAEFEERLRGAERAHAEEQAIVARGSAKAKSSEIAASIDEPSTMQKTAASTDVVSSAKSGSSWTRWLGWGSSKGSDESNKKS